MKQFFKITFACVLGVLIAGFLGSILLFFSLISIATLSAPSYNPTPNTVFSLKLNTTVVERVSPSPLEELKTLLQDEEIPMGLNDILTGIEKAKNDKRICGIYLNTDGYESAYATTEAIRQKLKEFKESGKFIIAYNDSYSQKQYYLSSVADSIYVNPVGNLSFDGIASQHIFFKNTLDKLGVQMQVFRVGTFKSAVEPFILDKMSDANREQTEVYIHSIWNTLLSDISQSRQLSVDSLNAIANLGLMLQEAEIAKTKGLVTDLCYKSAILPLLKDLSGKSEEKDVKTASLEEILLLDTPKENSKDQIAVLYATGEITSGPSSEGIYWEKTIKEINKIKEDENIKALVFRVNSPGGSAFASEQIWEAIESLKKTKPVVVSMGDYAASGGYYISCNANYIVAEPTTLTGSIGVFGLIPNANELLSNKLGLSFDEVKTNTFGNITIFEPMTDSEKLLMQKNVEQIYSLFIKRCAEGRGIPVDSIAKIAEGRVWTGSNALDLGLVDELGGLKTALDKAAELAGITQYGTTEYPAAMDFLQTLLSDLNGEATVRLQQHFMSEDLAKMQLLKYLRSLDKVQARMDYIVIQ